MAWLERRFKSKVDKAWVDVFQKANEERIEA